MLLNLSSAFISSIHKPIISTRRSEMVKQSLPTSNVPSKANIVASTQSSTSTTVPSENVSSNMIKRIITGFSLAFACTFVIVIGHLPFAALFALGAMIALQEYNKLVEATGLRTNVVFGALCGVFSMFTAMFSPNYHELVVPLSAAAMMFSVIFLDRKLFSIGEITTSIFGMIYLGFLPSFWIRLRELTFLFDGFTLPPMTNALLQPLAKLMTPGVVLLWWSWTAVALSDVGAYFVGVKFGKTKLSSFRNAAGQASPNKSLEGTIGGMVSCTAIAILGAYTMNWPHYKWTGATYGLMLSVFGLVGDLIASAMKRDAKIKDSGNVLPGHGGVLDRVDSYIFTAPLAYYFCVYVLPFFQDLIYNK